MKKTRRQLLGQHFLKDKSLTRAIADQARELSEKHRCQSILEIGPGKGALTDPLKIAIPDLPFILAEKDDRLAAEWKARPGFEVLDGDFLDQKPEAYLKKPPLLVASNLPYSAGTTILVELACQEQIPALILMFQFEVAKRLRAEPGNKDWGSLSLFIQNRWDVKKFLHVPPRAFAPPPKVDSEVVILERRKTLRIPETAKSPKLWDALLKAAFAHRRKMLRSGLPPRWRNALVRSQLDDTKRAEALTWEEWQRLFVAASGETWAAADFSDSS